MVEFKNILCPSDLSEASIRALTFAATFARWYNARLTLLHVVPTLEPVVDETATYNAAVQAALPVSHNALQEEMRRFATLANVGSVDVTMAIVDGHPAKRIVDYALETTADLVVMGTHGRSGFARLIIGSIAEKVVQKVHCPVLLVPPHAAGTARPEVVFKHILCAMDFSPSALQAFGFALDLARQSNGAVTVVYALEWLAEEEPREYAHFSVPEFRQHLLQDAEQRLRALIAEELPGKTTVEGRVVTGRAHREILKMATEMPADLIVMGAQGRGGLGLTLFGSTTQQVVRGATCPVLTVRGLDPSRRL